MELWYTDEHTRDVRFSMKVVEQIASRKSAVQQIDILDTPAYGRVLVLDGGLMITEKDEFIYHEMLAHVPMAVHPKVRNVLVIGGGDGGTVRDAHRHIAMEFPVSTVYQAHIPSYPSGHWLFGFASKKYHPIGNLDEARWNRLRIPTRYYNTALHRGAFALPNYVLDILKDEEPQRG